MGVLASPTVASNADVPLSLVDLLIDERPDNCLNPLDHAVLSFLDECIKASFSASPLDRQLEPLVCKCMPSLAINALTDGIREEIEDHPIVTILDLLIERYIGWSDDLGRAGKKLYDRFESALTSLADPNTDYVTLRADLIEFFDAEQQRIDKLEGRISDSESGILRAQRAQALTAQMLNAQMQDKQLPACITEFLQGPWCDSLQLMLIQYGVESDEWQRACKLTETIIWTLQPVELQETKEDEDEDTKEDENDEDRQRLYRIIEHIPNEIHELLVALKHDTHKAEAALSDIEMEHIKIMSGEKLAYEEFALLDCENDLISGSTTICKNLLKRVSQLEPGQWFLLGESAEQAARIKLVLKLDDVHQLLFTNRNGMKALQIEFEEFAYFLSSEAAKQVPDKAVCSSTLNATLQLVISDHETRQQKLREAEEQSKKERLAREAARIKALDEAATLTRESQAAEKRRAEEAEQAQLQKAKDEAERAENIENLQAATDKVLSLNISAWLKLPDPDGAMVECKLAVKLASVDKFVFADRLGVKMGEYSAAQLAELLASENGVVLDDGAEFEDTLAKVVTGLRQDRNKSYDDLSGHRTPD